MALTVNPSLPVIAAQATGSATTGVVLQPGAIVNAEVLKVAENLVQIAIAGLSIDVMSEVALTPGQNLQLAVSQTADGTVRLAVVGQGAGPPLSDTSGVANAASAVTTAPVNTPINTPAAINTQASTPAAINTIANPAQVAAPVTNDPLTPPERIAVSVVSATAATQQQSLAPLFANLNAVATTGSLPPALQQAVVQVLAQQTPLAPDLSGNDIQNAVWTSGLFLESSLATGAIPPAGIPDLKAALIVLRQTLAVAVQATETPQAVAPAVATAVASEATPASLSPPLVPALPEQAQPKQTQSAKTQSAQILPSDSHEVASPQPQPRLQIPSLVSDTTAQPTKLVLAEALLSAGPKSVTSGAALNLLQEALQELPRVNQPQTATVTLPGGQSAEAVVHTNTPPPPFRGALPSAQPVAAASIAPDTPLATTVRHLLDDTDAAIARQTLLQVASLPDRPDATSNRSDATMPRWNFEIPFATPQGTAMAQFEISRDGGGNEVEAAKRVWRARFSLDIEPAGPVHALISLIGERTSVRMWAERPQTASLLRMAAGDLSQALSQAELSPGDIVIREGTPPQPQPARAGHFLDRAS